MLKKILVLSLPVLFFLASCEEEIDIRVGEDVPVLLMNAQLRSDDTLHTVVLNYSRLSSVEPADQAVVRIRLNGTGEILATPVEQEEYYFSSPYRFRADFKPGDRVRIDAVRGSDHAWAEVTFPAPGEIASLEMTRHAENPYEVELHFRMLVNDIPGEASFYRLDMAREVEIQSHYAPDSGRPVRIWYESGTHRSLFDASEDPLIQEGRNSGSEVIDDILSDVLPGNAYSAFTDNLFRDGSYSLRFKAFRNGFIPEKIDLEAEYEDCKCDAVVKLYTMSHAQYRYLRAIDNFEAFGYDINFLVEPTTLPSNVEGGLGFVSAETCVCQRIRVDEFSRNNRYYGGNPYSLTMPEE